MLRIGIVGARFAAELHAVNYRQLRGNRVELTAVCARARSQAEAFAKHHRIAHVFTDYRQLVESSMVDVVDVCAITEAHAAIAMAAARAGKHLIVEKPLTGYFGDAGTAREQMLTDALASADGVIAATERAGVTLCYAEDYVYAPPVAKYSDSQLW
jgi:predicted dinucleotide-utilizing enzyme